MLFKSSKREGLVSLAEYKEAMKEGQDAIYYILGEDEKLLKNSPLLEKFNEDGIEVLILDTEVDNIVMPMVNKYKEIDLKSVSSVTSAEALMGYEDFVNRVKEILKDDIKDVKVTNRLKNSPSCLVYDDSDPSNAMNKILKQMGQAVPDAKPIFEINIEHPIIKKLLTNDKIFEDGIKLLFDGAKMAEGSKLSDMSEYIQRVNRVLLQAL